MKIVSIIFLMAVVIAAPFSATAQAPAPLFFDGFLADNAGQPANNYNLFFLWNVTDGSVDLVGGNVIGVDDPAAGGRYVDLGGSTNDSGSFTTKTPISFTAGATYNLSFRFNSVDGNSNSATARIGSQVFEVTSSSTVFQQFSQNFTFASPTTANLVFQDTGVNDNNGIGIDTVQVSLVANAAPVSRAALNLLDFDGDSRADYSVFRPSNSTLYIRNSATASFFGNTFGDAANDTFQPGDYDGDRRTDPAVFRNSTGVFYVLQSSTNTLRSVQFGQFGDEPVARDYSGDGRVDFAVVRRAGGSLTWYILNSATNQFTATRFGADTDVKAPGDYDGDGRFDLAVFRGAGNQLATFFVQRSTAGFTTQQFGIGSDLVVPGDYDGDGRTDFAVVRAGTAFNWFILRSSNNSYFGVQFGEKPHLTIQNDYDGDGRTDIAVWNPLNGVHYVIRSSGGGTAQTQFGRNGDYPLANYDTH